MSRSPGQRNNPVLHGEEALEVLHTLAEREPNVAHIILDLGQRILRMEGTSIRNGMNYHEDSSDMASYAVAFTHPHRNINFVGFLTSQQTGSLENMSGTISESVLESEKRLGVRYKTLTTCYKVQPVKARETGIISAESKSRTLDRYSISSAKSTIYGAEMLTLRDTPRSTLGASLDQGGGVRGTRL